MKPKHRTVPTAPARPVVSSIAGGPRATKLAALLRLGVPGALAGFACLAGAQQAAPEAVTLNPVVVTGAPTATESFDLPYSVDSVDMRANQAGNLGVNASEALAGVPGLVIQNRQNYAQDLQISVRGFGARAAFGVRGVKLIADGIPATNPDGQGQAATFNLDTAERIEVMRGPFATVYGNHAGGVIQLFSRKGEGEPRVRASALGGSWGTTKFGVGAEGEKDGIGFVLDASRFDTDGYRDHSKTRRDQGFAKLTLNPDEDSTLTLVANGLRQPETQDPLGVTWETYERDPQSLTIDPFDTETPKRSYAARYNTRKSIHHVQGGATYERRLGEDRLQLSAYAGRRAVTQYQSFSKGFQSSPRHAGGVVDFDRDFHGMGLRWISQRTLGSGELTLTAGIDYDHSEDDRRGYENFVGSTLGVKGALRRDELDTITSIDPYVQALWKSGPWQWSLGARHSRVSFKVEDRYIRANNPDDSGSVRFSKTTPALGVSYALSPATNLYASVGAGYETPTLNELSYATPTTGFNFGLRPSTSRQAEIGIKTFVSDNARINAALFRIETDDEIVVSASEEGRTSYQNAGRTLRQGIELAAHAELTRTLTARASLTWMQAEYDEAFTSRGTTVAAGNRIPGVPRIAAFAELAWQATPGVTFAGEVLHRGEVEVSDLNNDRAAPAYTLFNLRLSAEQRQGPWTFGQLLRLDNVLDRKYVGSVIVSDSNKRYYEPGPERSVYAGVSASYRF
ncbi:TonB-dependent receptor [Thauera sp.]|uniref:TonB-dependent receptor family protein n=1 Tax=Thauera sp. TaxID=1905334 RepID=UPI002C639F9D|nr:TonB-dependent receptor [Thauera sp.]HRO37132.1 TonB-dependent receptor [Thauera sp.]